MQGIDWVKVRTWFEFANDIQREGAANTRMGNLTIIKGLTAVQSSDIFRKCEKCVNL